MRMWMVNPKLLCRQHLLGEHNEIHKAVGNLRKSGTWAKALIKKGYLNPKRFLSRHNLLVKEMIKRGYNHKSKLNISKIQLIKGTIDVNKSIRDLKARCKKCDIIANK